MFYFAGAYTQLKGKDSSCKPPLEVSLDTLVLGRVTHRVFRFYPASFIPRIVHH